MNKQLVLLAGIAVIAVIGLVIFSTRQNALSQNSSGQQLSESEKMQMKKQEEKEKSPIMMDNKDGNYIEYSQANHAMAAQKGKTVLFFHASWCPTCKAAEEAFMTRSSEIPEDITILKVDYDTYTDLKKKYGITYQHTFVQIDTNGNEVAKWNGGDIEELKANLK